jgi:hypothetical protein
VHRFNSAHRSKHVPQPHASKHIGPLFESAIHRIDRPPRKGGFVEQPRRSS